MPTKPRVLYVVHDFLPEVTAGTELHTLWLAHELSQKYEVFVFTGTHDPSLHDFDVRDAEFRGLKVRRVKCSSKDWVHPSNLYLNSRIDDRFVAYVDEVKPALIHVHHTIGLSASIIELAARHDIPLILQLRDFFYMCDRVFLRDASDNLCNGPHDGKKCANCIRANSTSFIPKDIASLYSQIFEQAGIERTEYMKTLLLLPDIIISPTTFVKQKFVEFGIPASKIIVSREGVKVDHVHSPKRGKEKDTIVFGFLGNIAYYKGLHVLIEAFRNLDQSRAALRIYGRADDELLTAKLKAECSNLNVKFMGGYTHERVPDILSRIDVLVHPSIIHESSSIVIQEALAAKVPVIVSDIPAQKYAIRDGIDGLHFHVEDASDLNSKMKLLVENPEKLLKFRQNILSVRTIADQSREFAEIYEELIRKVERDPAREGVLSKLEAVRRAIDTTNFEEQMNLRRIALLETGDLIRTLLVLYESRPDLQESYPEVRKGELGGLVSWALQVIRGGHSDSSYEELASSASKPIFTNLQDLEKKILDKVQDLEKKILDKDNDIRKLEESISGLEKRVFDKDNHITNLERHIDDLEAKIRDNESSLAWKTILRYRRFNERWFPPGTRRRELGDRAASALKTTMDHERSELLRAALNHYVMRRSQQADLNERYQLWLKKNQLTETQIFGIRERISRLTFKPKMSVLMPVYNTDPKWLKAAIDSVKAQLYQNWELCIADDHSSSARVRELLESYADLDARIKIALLPDHRGIAGASNEALNLASGEYAGLLDHDDELHQEALYEVVRAINEDPTIDYIYSDEDKIDSNGRKVEAFFKPDWSPDLLLSMNYVTHFSVYRRSLLEKVGGFRPGYDGSQDYDLVLRITEITDRIKHIQKPLYSWRKIHGSSAAAIDAKPLARSAAMKAINDSLRRRGVDGRVEDGFTYGYYRVRYRIAGMPLVSIIIPNKNKVELLQKCVQSIVEKTTYKKYELIIMDNNSDDKETLKYLSTLPQVIRITEPYNFSRINNLGAAHSKGDYLVFLNNDTEVLTPDWVESLLEHAQRPDVGMAAPVLLYPPEGSDGAKIQNAGEVIAAGGVANGAFRGLPAESPGYFSLAKVIRNCSSLTAAALAVSRSVFTELGGFDEMLPVAFNDVDLCLRAREKGYRLVINPHALLYHHEKATRGEGHPRQDETYFIAKWSHVLVKGDPYYNPNLNHLRVDHMISPHPFCESHGLAVLLELHYQRRDLQIAYPEVTEGRYDRLIDWAAKSGVTEDSARYLLRPYSNYYVGNCSENVKPLASILLAYNSNQALQDSYPEVLRGDYERLQAALSSDTSCE